MITARRMLFLGSAFADQACFAFANLVVHLLMARWLGQNDYGVFSVAFTIYTFGFIIFTGFLVEPMMVYGSGHYASRLSAYLAILRRMYWTRMWPVVASVVLVISLCYQSRSILVVSSVLAVASGPLLFQWMQRRSCHLWRRPWISATGGLVYLIVVVSLSMLAWRSGVLTAASSVMVMMFGAIAGGSVILAWTRRLASSSGADPRSGVESKEVVGRHWNYGRWAVLTNIFNWIPGNVYMLTLPFIGGEGDAARLRAALNLWMPIIQFQMALSPIVLPWLVRRVSSPSFREKVATLSLVMCIPAVGWMLVLWQFGEEIQGFVYRGNYQEPSYVLALIGTGSLLNASLLVVAASLRAQERPDLVLRGYVGATVACLLVGVPLMTLYGLTGVAIGLGTSVAVNLAILSRQLVRTGRKHG